MHATRHEHHAGTRQPDLLAAIPFVLILIIYIVASAERRNGQSGGQAAAADQRNGGDLDPTRNPA